MSSNLPSQSSSWDADEAIDWALSQPGRAALSCSFGGPSGIVVLDMVMRRDRSVPVYYLDTGLLFPQTYELAARVAQRYGIEPLAISPWQSVHAQQRTHGAALWQRDPNRCCDLRKVQPQAAFLEQYDIWLTGLRRDQSSTRAAIPLLQYDPRFRVTKVNPLAGWSGDDVWQYVRAYDLPYNDLNDRGYPSVGCVPCTRAVNPGEDVRAGRWPGTEKKECGLHAGGGDR
ncbi:MAG TPA: phosphoadenylyl-sulfate reductase [Candidatus Baltobacteraceae bacterium]|jgi:phosphoadenosine phosphosulfate reductase|nr:phosphoadenylyl-sulfate reductase [Candidatus Baltobacteraceae bacterium]